MQKTLKLLLVFGTGLIAAVLGCNDHATDPAAVALDAVQLVKRSGDGQVGPKTAALTDSIVVKTIDRYGNAVPGVTVTFTVSSGGGSVSPGTDTADATGDARTSWTLGDSAGTQTVTVRVSGAQGSSITFSAVASDLLIWSIARDTLVEGQTASITGHGFDPTPERNTVTIDGVAAAVTAATATQLAVTVPSFDCQPSRSVRLEVTVSGVSAQSASKRLEPAAGVLDLAVGEQVIIEDPADFCLQFAATSEHEEYLLGIQSATDDASIVTPVRLTSVTTYAAPQAPPLASFAGAAIARGLDLDAFPSERDDRMIRHRRAEARLRALERKTLLAVRTRAGPVAQSRKMAVPSSVPPDAKPGDVFAVRVVDLSGDGKCYSFTPISAVVRVVGSKGIWLEDVDNPSGGFSATDLQLVSDQFDQLIYPTVVEYFGEPTDLDSNNRVVLVITQAVNKTGSRIGGFINQYDFFAADCVSANGGEFFYARAPDPTAAVGDPVTVVQALEQLPFIIAHEFAHTIQFGRRAAQAGFSLGQYNQPERFLAEGQATLAEEVVGHAAEGNSIGMNYGYEVAFNADVALVDWYQRAFSQLAVYYGARDEGGATPKVRGAPHECSWLSSDSSPCDGNTLVHGVPWALLRWISDHYGPSFAGGEQELHRALVDNPLDGFASIEDVVGVPIEQLLAQWAAMLYVDDRVPTQNVLLTMPSWNLADIFGDPELLTTFRSPMLEPTRLGFTNRVVDREVVAGSTAYFLISCGDGRDGTAIRVRGQSDEVLPSHMQVFVVRTQ